jgi:hypothetical protein
MQSHDKYKYYLGFGLKATIALYTCRSPKMQKNGVAYVIHISSILKVEE